VGREGLNRITLMDYDRSIRLVGDLDLNNPPKQALTKTQTHTHTHTKTHVCVCVNVLGTEIDSVRYCIHAKTSVIIKVSRTISVLIYFSNIRNFILFSAKQI
jgi:hypothetical protein